MKTKDLKSEKIFSELYGSNEPFELETYVEVTLLIVGVTGRELADKDGTCEYITNKLSENLNMSHSQVFNFEAVTNREPYQLSLRLNFTFNTENIGRLQIGKAKDLEYEILEKFRANAINLS